jgi:hypothetical protein
MNIEDIKAARAALDAMDDQARCSAGADCIGPRGVLEAFIARAEAGIAPEATGTVDAALGLRDAERALKGIRRVIAQDTAREGAKATLALLLDDDVATLAGFINSATPRDALRYRAVRQHAYRYGVGNPTPEQLDADVDAHLVACGACSQEMVQLKGWTRVEARIPERLPDGRQFSREVLVVDRTRNTPPRMARVHYYDNHPPVWEGGDPTHWRDVPDLPDAE